MDMPESAKLQQTILRVAMQDGVPCVNQTSYRPLEQSLIAVSIETKAEQLQQDPLNQLGIWASAWHERMHGLWARLGSSTDLGELRLPTLPLIQAVGHVWRVYFAKDRGTFTDVYAPMTVGSTEDVVSTYILLASLRAGSRTSFKKP